MMEQAFRKLVDQVEQVIQGKREPVQLALVCLFAQRGSRMVQTEGGLEFWSDWEPESEVIAPIADPLPIGPRYIYKPYYELPCTYAGLQNTDPFVF